MLKFLSAASSGDWSKLGFVLGNVSCDMDSVVSSILHSFNLNLRASDGHLWLPVMNIPDLNQLQQRLDIAMVLEQCEISP